MEKIREILQNKQDCCGCTACASICPKNAIKMKPDVLGFMYPEVDEGKCVDCNLCEKICAFHSPAPKPIQSVYLARLKDERELELSRSGGAFFAIACYILENGGVVYGAAFDENFLVSHQRAEDMMQLQALRGTKYVQSDLKDTFLNCKKDLNNGKMVLFSGTPCQIAGLKSFISTKESNNLFTIDLLCHGVPSPNIWKDYLRETSIINRKKIKKASFRDKKYGWKACRNSFVFEDGSRTFSRLFSDYFYHKWICLRMSCKDCPFASNNRVGDITIGDGWTYESIDSKFNEDDKGVSFVMINTKKGQNLFDKSKYTINLISTTLSACMQDPLCQSVPFNKNRLNFERDYQRYGYWYVRLVYLPYIFHLGKRLIEKIIRRF